MTPPVLHLERSFVATLGLLIATAAVSIDLSLPAIPRMADALGAPLPLAQKIVGVFIAGMACGQIPVGLLSDRLGRLPVLYAGMAVFLAAAVAAAAATDIRLMLLARFVQGAGAAAAIVLTRAIVRDVASGKEAARLMSLMTMIFTAAPVIAPSIGAVLVTHWGWRAPFAAIALFGLVMLGAIRGNLSETHAPSTREHPLRQLLSSVREFFSHRQSIFGLLLIVLPPAGFMSIVTTSAALAIEIYGFTVQQFGLIFACAGLSILFGASVNRVLVARHDLLGCLAIGVTLVGLSAAQLLAIAWLDAAPFWYVWGNICVFMFTAALLMSNAMIVALDPLPSIAGVASSIIGTVQNVAGAASALLSAAIWDGSVRRSVITIGIAGAAIVLVFLSRSPLIAPGPFRHHSAELARD